MNLHTINDLSNKKIINFLKTNLSNVTDQNLIKNYHPDFFDTPGNLFYILKEGRYKDGNYYVLEDNGAYCGSAGWNPYTYRNEQLALGLTRCYLAKEYRNKWLLSKYFLPNIVNDTVKFKKIWLTMNNYNRTLYKGFELLSSGRSVGIGDPWPKVFNIFSPIGKKTIYSTKQYVVEFDRSKNIS